MKLLFDTHTFIWWDSEPSKLSPKALDLLSDKSNVKLLSIVSIWEIQIKYQLGKLYRFAEVKSQKSKVKSRISKGFG